MPEHDYDIIAIGGGLGGSALAKVMAEHGHRVLVLERVREFKDRVRGEWIAPWGVAEAKQRGILISCCVNARSRSTAGIPTLANFISAIGTSLPPHHKRYRV